METFWNTSHQNKREIYGGYRGRGSRGYTQGHIQVGWSGVKGFLSFSLLLYYFLNPDNYGVPLSVGFCTGCPLSQLRYVAQMPSIAISTFFLASSLHQYLISLKWSQPIKQRIMLWQRNNQGSFSNWWLYSPAVEFWRCSGKGMYSPWRVCRG